MATATATKVTSTSSPASLPTAPNPTPATGALDSPTSEPVPQMDFSAVSKILAPITETLNESAHEAMYPSPPINTPVLGSPTPSLVYRFPSRGRGFSAIGDRLAQLKIDDRKLLQHRHDAFCNASSNPEECDVSECSISETLSDNGKEKTTVDPRIEEYLSDTSKHQSARALGITKDVTLAEHVANTSSMSAEAPGLRSQVSLITEGSNWGTELELCIEEDLMRLEQLAQDEHTADPSKSFAEYYVEHLKRILGSGERRVPVEISTIIQSERIDK